MMKDYFGKSRNQRENIFLGLGKQEKIENKDEEMNSNNKIFISKGSTVPSQSSESHTNLTVWKSQLLYDKIRGIQHYL